MCKRIIAALLSLVMLLSCVPVMAFAEDHPTATLTVSDIYTTPGSTVTIDVMIEDNPGILGATLKLSWNDGLTLIGCENGTAFSELTFQKPSRYQNGCNFVWYGSSIAEAADGIILSLTFVVEETATDADIYDISITYGSGDVVDENYAPVDLTVKNGSIRIVTYTPGDVTGDGRVNTLDLIKLCQYISDDCVTDPEGFNVTLNESAADVNDDSKLNPLDLILISQYISDGCVTNPDGYNVTLKPSTPRCRHKMTKVDAKDATCTEEGNIEYWFCGECGKCFDSKGGNTELTLDDVVVAAKGHTEVIDEAVLPTYTSTGLSEGKHCSVCGFVIVPQEVTGPLTKDEYSIQYVCDMVPLDANGAPIPIPSDTYKPGETKVLYEPKMDTYKFLGWSDKNGKFYGLEIPKGTTGDIVLYANWVSNRNQAVPISKLGDPIICEDSNTGQIIFVYEIGTIKNIPLFETQDLLVANGLITSHGIVKQTSITKTNAEEIGKIIANTTTNSSTWTFSKDWDEVMSVSAEWAEQQGMTLEEAEQFCKNNSNTYNVVNSSGGSSSLVNIENSSFRITGNQAHTESKYDEDQKYTNFKVDGKLSNSTTISSELSASLNASIGAGITVPLKIGEGNLNGSVGGSVGATVGLSNTFAWEIGGGYEQSEYTKDISTGTDSWENGLDFSKSKSSTSTSAKTWNNSTGYSASTATSSSEAISKAVSELISQKNSKDSSYSTGGEEGEAKEYAASNAQEDKYSSTVTFSNAQIEISERTFTSTGNTYGAYRLVQTGSAHVFAVVAYDIKSSTYYTYTYSVLDDDEYKEYLDYSYDRTFNDYETSTLPFEIPVFVNDYVNSRVASSKLQISDDGVVTKYLGTAEDEIVLIPSYYTRKNNTTGETEMIKVTGIAEGLFKNNTNIIGVSLGNFINEIPASAFEGCTALKEVICPNVIRIGANAFKGCTSLSEFALPNEIEYIGNGAFEGIPAINSNAPTKEIANIIANSNIQNITLNISRIDASDFGDLQFSIGGIETFKLLGGYKEYKGLEIKSDAKTTIISGINIPSCEGIPIRTSSSNVTLERVTVSGEGFALILEADTTTLSLEGESQVNSKNEYSILAKNIMFSEINAETYSTIITDGKALVCDTVSNNDGYIANEKIKIITEEEYTNYLSSRKITFDANGGTVGESYRVVVFGTKLGALPNPTRTGYDFVGWFTDNNIQMTEDTVFSAVTDITLTAKWTAKSYKVSWNTGSGYSITVNRTSSPYANATTGTISSGSTVYYGDVLSISYVAKTGYTLTSKGSESLTVTSNVTSSNIFASAKVNAYTISWTTGTGYTISVKRTSSPLAGVATGVIANGATVYHGDVLTITYTANTGYTLSSKGNTCITVTGNVTASSIYATATANSYTYSVVYKSSNGTPLGTSSCTYKYGTTNTVYAPAKTGYNAPASQSVKWDSTSDKTITFIYTPIAVENTTKTGQIYKEGSSILNYSAKFEYRNRTATSVEVRVVWTSTLLSGWNECRQRFTVTIGSQKRGPFDVVDIFQWSQSVNYARSAERASDWITVPLSTTEATSVNVGVYFFQANYYYTDLSDTQASLNKTWAVSIPAY